ncbi:transmembrane protein 164 [Hydra vulgaris]|uniref:Transmembrane protein 164 n=1 Tax=Hydra vulgaris TaxID=6087 RepID=A0ABM4B602_HYDVU
MMYFSVLIGIKNLFLSSYSGVNHSISGNGGVDCYNFISLEQRFLDTFVFTVIFGITLLPYISRSLYCPHKLDIEKLCIKSVSKSISGVRKLLLIILSFIFGIQVGFKILKCVWLFLLNPCHVITGVQIYLLGSEPSRTSVAIFRVHNHLLFGAFLALFFPVLNTFESIGEQVMYWLQHLLIAIVVPPYLMFVGGAYSCEPLTDLAWPFLGVLIFFFYMMYFLQSIALMTLVNLNSVLCPAISDPFYGPSWRWFAMIHQPLLILSFGKIYTICIFYIFKLLNIYSGKKKECFIDLFENPKKSE